MQLKNSFFDRIAFWRFALVIAVVVAYFGYKEKGWSNTYINGDGLGYYAYLPAVFIYHDLSFGFIEKYEKDHYQQGQHSDFRQETREGKVNRYYAGTSVLQLPFFLIVHAYCRLTGQDSCGYSGPYQYGVLFAACFYLFVGLWVLMLILQFYFRGWVSRLVPVVILLSTPLLFYTIYNPDFSHIYSFAVVNLFVYNAILYFRTNSVKNLCLLFVFAGLIAIIRPVNVLIILLLPFLAGDWKVFWNGALFAFRKLYVLLTGFLIWSTIIFIQLYLYYLQTGHFWVYSYGPYGFDFLHPHFLDILFSYRKGLFVYTPILFVSLAGLFFLFKQSLFRGIYLLGFLTLLIYVLSAWSFWTYGMTYGQRPFIEYYLIFSILLGFLLSKLKKYFKIALMVLLGILCYHNFLQMSQYRHYILHWDEMDRQKYWKVFLQTDPIYYGYLWSGVTPMLADTAGYIAENRQAIKLNLHASESLKPISVLSEDNTDSLDIIFSLKVFPQSEHLKNNKLVVQVRRTKNYEENGFDFEISMRCLEPNQWNEVQKRILLPKSPKEDFSIQIFNTGKYDFEIDDMKILKRKR